MVLNFSATFSRSCFAVVVACAPGALGREHISFIDDVTKLLEANIRHLRHRELRSCARAHGFNRTLAVCKQWASISLPELFNDVLHISSRCLPGCCVYLSLLQPGGDELRCVASNTQSNMYGKRLLRGQGVSFNCLEPATNKDIVVGLSTEHVHVFNQQNYGLLVDPFNGKKDLEKKIIRTPLNAVGSTQNTLKYTVTANFGSQILTSKSVQPKG